MQASDTYIGVRAFAELVLGEKEDIQVLGTFL